MKNNYSVNYISNTPKGDDTFDNEPHKSVAITLTELIRHHKEIKHPIIGIEGEWGSGKTNVVEMLGKKLKEEKSLFKYEFFTYDVWGHQEDLTRRSFLEELIAKLSNNFLCCGLDWEKEKENLTARRSNKTVKKFPQIKFFYVLILLIPVTIFIIDLCEKVFGYDKDALLNYNQLKGIFSLGLLILAIIEMVISIYRGYKVLSIRSKSLKNKDKELRGSQNKRESFCIKYKRFQKVIGRTVYAFQGKEIDSNERENIIEDEPSVCRFQEIFCRLINHLNSNTILIIVFDNMDRLCDNKKLMSVWTSVHAFFADKEYDGKVWVLIPYDKQQLAKLFCKEDEASQKDDTKTMEFINKTFFTSFRISTPILSAWKSYMNTLFDNAFSPELSEEEKRLISIIFGKTVDITKIKPREIISYVNSIVSLYIQHKSKDIGVPYLALYNQYKDKIAASPIEEILNFNSYASLVDLFDNQEELRKIMGALFYNIGKDKSIEVILRNEIENMLRQGHSDDEFKKKLDLLTSTSQFKYYIDEILTGITDINEYNLKSISNLLEFGGKNISASSKQLVWKKIEEQATENNTIEYNQLYPWHKYYIVNCPLRIANKIIKAIITNITPKTDNKKPFNKYYDQLIKLLKLQNDREGLVVIPPDYICNPEEFKEIYQYLKSENLLESYYDKLKITINTDAWATYFTKPIDKNDGYYDSERIQDIEILEYLISKKTNVSAIKQYNDSVIDNLHESVPTEIIDLVYIINRIVNEKIEKVPTCTYDIYDIDTKTTSNNDIIMSMLFMLYHKKQYASYIPNIVSALKSHKHEDWSGLNRIYDKYLDFSAILKLSVDYNGEIPTLNDLVRHLIIFDVKMDVSNCSYIFKNLDKIKEYVLNRDENDILGLLNKLNDSESHFDSAINNIFDDVSPLWFNLMDKSNIDANKSFQYLITGIRNAFKNLTDEDWSQVFNGKGRAHEIISTLSEKDLINKDIYRSLSIDKGVGMAFEKFLLSSNIGFDKKLFEKYYSSTTNTIKEHLTSQLFDRLTTPTNIETDKLRYFAIYLFRNSNRIKQISHKSVICNDYIVRILTDSDLEGIVDFVKQISIELSTFIDVEKENISEDQFKHISRLIFNQIETNKEHDQIGILRDFAQKAKLIQPVDNPDLSSSN